MTPAEYRMASGLLTFLALASLLYLLQWQLRIWPSDRQKWAATLFVGATGAIILQLSVSYLGGPTMATSWRGFASWTVWVGSTLWLALETREHFVEYGRRIEAAKAGVPYAPLPGGHRRHNLIVAGGVLLIIFVIAFAVWRY